MGNCLFLRARGWGIDRQMRTKLQIPVGMPGGGMVTRRIEPCITGEKIARNSLKLVSIGKSLNPNSRKFVSSGKSLNPNSQKFVSSGKSLNPNSRKFVPPKHGTFDSSQNIYCSFFATAQVISHILIFSSFII